VITNENFWFWFGGIWLTVGVLFALIGGGVAVTGSSVAARLDAAGTRATGVVLVKEVALPDDGPDAYRVTFRFTDTRGKSIRGDADVTPESWDVLVERGPIEVVYLADRPDVHRVPGQHDDDAVIAFLFPLVGAVIAGVGGFVLLHARRSRRGERSGQSATTE
jgi:hypothetical protein